LYDEFSMHTFEVKIAPFKIERYAWGHFPHITIKIEFIPALQQPEVTLNHILRWEPEGFHRSTLLEVENSKHDLHISSIIADRKVAKKIAEYIKSNNEFEFAA